MSFRLDQTFNFNLALPPPQRHSSRRTASSVSRPSTRDSQARKYHYYTQSGGRVLEIISSRPPSRSRHSDRPYAVARGTSHTKTRGSEQRDHSRSTTISRGRGKARASNVVEQQPIEGSSSRLRHRTPSRRRTSRSDTASHRPSDGSSASRNIYTIVETSTATPSQRSDSDHTIRPLKFRHVAGPSSVSTRYSSIFSSWFGGNAAIPPRNSSGRRPVRLVECLVCASDDVPSTESAKLACGHRMCHTCLRQVFVLSTTDPAHMPPKCCTKHHIPLKHVETLFDDRFKSLWNRKYREFTTKDRLYCPSKKCGEWITPSSIHTDSRHPNRKYGVCRRCKTKVCGTCNNKYHKCSKCPSDPETARFIATAKEQGWQRCYNCRAMVELKEGCNHMTCRCNAEFCIVCGSPWKTCECPWFNYDALLEHERLDHIRIPEDPMDYRFAHRVRPRNYGEELDMRFQQEMDDQAVAQQLEMDMILEALNPRIPAPRPRRRSTSVHTHRTVREVREQAVPVVREPPVHARDASVHTREASIHAREASIRRHRAAPVAQQHPRPPPGPIAQEPSIQIHMVQIPPVTARAAPSIHHHRSLSKTHSAAPLILPEPAQARVAQYETIQPQNTTYDSPSISRGRTLSIGRYINGHWVRGPSPPAHARPEDIADAWPEWFAAQAATPGNPIFPHYQSPPGERYDTFVPARRAASPASQADYIALDVESETPYVPDSALNEAGMATVLDGGRKAAANFVRIAQNGGKAVGHKSTRIMGWLDRIDPLEGLGAAPGEGPS